MSLPHFDKMLKEDSTHGGRLCNPLQMNHRHRRAPATAPLDVNRKRRTTMLSKILTTHLDKGRLCTRLHRKATVGNFTLHASSSHPKSLINSIPYGELLRLKRNRSNELEFQAAAKESTQCFSVRG